MSDVRTAQRYGSASEWTIADTVLFEGEIGVEEDTGKFKIGNGVSPWHLLPYYIDENGVEALIEEFMATFEGGTLDPRVGDLETLSTQNKTTIVDSINEVNLPGVPYSTLYNNAKAG